MISMQLREEHLLTSLLPRSGVGSVVLQGLLTKWNEKAPDTFQAFEVYTWENLERCFQGQLKEKNLLSS